ncbi:MAG TPA: hypothetical protein VJ325_03550 [Thiobacillus sp.]|nr:hypothetical protein [Thiobacillus sp.]
MSLIVELTAIANYATTNSTVRAGQQGHLQPNNGAVFLVFFHLRGTCGWLLRIPVNVTAHSGRT